MIEQSIVRQIVSDYIADSEYFIVDVNVSKDNSIVVEIDSNEGVSIDYCAELTRHIESQLDREVEDYELEVGSAGLTSPFKVLEQYRKYEGEEVEVLADGVKHQGILVNVTDNTFGVEETKMVKPEGAKRKVEVKETFTFEYDKIKYTKYTIRFK
ncbi:MAG: ribosome assembly cofactor RimP [Paludibacteraceae bacterium]|nr:ribosome assembly cofactor RimP [Paludibacteraceae bacterium]